MPFLFIRQAKWYFPEAIPNAIDSAIKGDFKEDDGSYSDKVGKFIGGLNPIGDVRDITANDKKVVQGDGDVAESITNEVSEELAESAVIETSKELPEKIAEKPAKKLPKSV